MQVVAKGLLTNYVRVGVKGTPTILVLHGWADSSQGWLTFIKRLEDKYDVIIPDLPGFGGSDRPKEPWGLDEYAQHLHDFLQKVDFKPYAIVAHSNGGGIAVRGLAKGLFKAEKLVLLASAGVRTKYKGRKKALRIVAKTGKVLVSPLPEALKNRMRKKMYTTVGSDMLVVESLQETFKKIVSDDIQADAEQLLIPALLIYGDQDVSTPLSYGQLLHQKLQASTLEVIGGAGHFIHIEQPARVAASIREFLGE